MVVFSTIALNSVAQESGAENEQIESELTRARPALELIHGIETYFQENEVQNTDERFLGIRLLAGVNAGVHRGWGIGREVSPLAIRTVLHNFRYGYSGGKLGVVASLGIGRIQSGRNLGDSKQGAILDYFDPKAGFLNYNQIFSVMLGVDRERTNGRDGLIEFIGLATGMGSNANLGYDQLTDRPMGLLYRPTKAGELLIKARKIRDQFLLELSRQNFGEARRLGNDLDSMATKLIQKISESPLIDFQNAESISKPLPEDSPLASSSNVLQWKRPSLPARLLNKCIQSFYFMQRGI